MWRLPKHFAHLKQRNQFLSRAPNPRLDRPKWAFEYLRNVLVRQFMFVEQDKRLAVLVTNPPKCQLHFLCEVSGRLGVRRVINELVIADGSHHWLPPASRKSRPAAVTRDRQQPRLEVPVLVPTGKALQSPDKRLLSRIFRVLAVAEHPEAQSEYLVAISVDKVGHRILIAGKTTIGQ